MFALVSVILRRIFAGVAFGVTPLTFTKSSLLTSLFSWNDSSSFFLIPLNLVGFVFSLKRTLIDLEQCTVAAKAAGLRALSTAVGCLSMTVNSQPEASGVLRPPSQCLIASRLNPNVLEKLSKIPLDFVTNYLTQLCWE